MSYFLQIVSDASYPIFATQRESIWGTAERREVSRPAADFNMA